MNFQDFKNKYCKETPIVNLDPKIQGWNSYSIAFEHAIHKTKPDSIVEVGTWLGASAINMANLSESPIICIDTFLGSNEILWRQNNVQDLTKNFTQIYDQFCANITFQNLNQQISPLPMTSSSASELFDKEEVKADLVYLDAGHQYREIYADLQDWWPLTNKVLIGDDYSSQWPGVIQATNQFVNEENLKLQILDSKFLIFR